MPRESRIPVGNAELYSREIGQGTAIIVLHGGPDFDHSYLLPELDRLSDSYHLIYYDQRGRGRSADGVKPEDVTLASDIADIEKVRQYYHLDSVVLLGHSWGTVLALEYALRYPGRVSHMILMNPAPAAEADYKQLRNDWLEKRAEDMERRKAIADTALTKRPIPMRLSPTIESISSQRWRDQKITKSSSQECRQVLSSREMPESSRQGPSKAG